MELDYSSVPAFMASFQKFGQSNMVEAKKLLDTFLAEYNPKVPTGWIELYHGAPPQNAKNIHANGFELTIGKRSGFMGSTNIVDNQGIFLTDKKEMAHYFGDNRNNEYGVSHVVFTAHVDPKTITTFEQMSLRVRKLGADILEQWDGKKYRNIPQSYQWWLLDKPEFVEALKEEGFTGVKFRETIAVRRSANGGTEALTYLIFDPKDILLIRKAKNEDFYNWMKSRQ